MAVSRCTAAGPCNSSVTDALKMGVDSEQVFGGEPQRVGSFRFFLDGQRWEWSDAVAQMHGYPPGEVPPTTELLLSHKHPEDHPRVARVLDRMVNDAEPFSRKHRIIDTAGTVHQVVVVGDRLHDDADQVIGTTGFYIDITDSYRSDVEDSVDEAVAELVQSRAVIEQAKGALMLVYGIASLSMHVDLVADIQMRSPTFKCVRVPGFSVIQAESVRVRCASCRYPPGSLTVRRRRPPPHGVSRCRYPKPHPPGDPPRACPVSGRSSTPRRRRAPPRPRTSRR